MPGFPVLGIKSTLERWLPQVWYGTPRPNLLLRSLSRLFLGVVRARHAAYRLGLKRIFRAPVPVIVVGNLTVGGTGKTPLVIWLTRFLAARGFRPGIVSRGFGGHRRSAPLRVVADSEPEAVGDEPVLLARRAGCPVVVSPDRSAAVQALLREGPYDVIVCDDGLQHYALARDIEIAVIDGERRLGNGYVLPAGPLREPGSRLCSVDCVVCQGNPEPGEFQMALEGQQAVSVVAGGPARALESFSGTRVHAVAAIGNPGRFFAHLRGFGMTVDAHAFPDHHPFRPEDLLFQDDAPVLMTEKDAVKCERFATDRYWYVPVRATLSPDFGDTVLTLLETKKNGSTSP